jgi:hypothetical protein
MVTPRARITKDSIEAPILVDLQLLLILKALIELCKRSKWGIFPGAHE